MAPLASATQPVTTPTQNALDQVTQAARQNRGERPTRRSSQHAGELTPSPSMSRNTTESLEHTGAQGSGFPGSALSCRRISVAAALLQQDEDHAEEDEDRQHAVRDMASALTAQMDRTLSGDTAEPRTAGGEPGPPSSPTPSLLGRVSSDVTNWAAGCDATTPSTPKMGMGWACVQAIAGTPQSNRLSSMRHPSRLERASRDLVKMLQTDAIRTDTRLKTLEGVYQSQNLEDFDDPKLRPSVLPPVPASDVSSANTDKSRSYMVEDDPQAPAKGKGKAGYEAPKQPPASRDGSKRLMQDGENDKEYKLHDAYQLLRQRTWMLMNDPESSVTAYRISAGILVLILISSVTFCLETMPSLKTDNSKLWFAVIEIICVVIFTIEYCLKLWAAPDTKAFVIEPMNLIDLVAIMPFYLQVLASSALNNTRILRIVRLVRVFRILKLGGRFGKIQVVATAMFESLDMLGMLMFLLSLSVIIFSTLIYFTERGESVTVGDFSFYSRETDISCGKVLTNDEQGNPTMVEECVRIESPFESIPDSFWWCMVTLMTVGYGDVYPTTDGGKVVASLAMVASVLLLALPISVIGTEFTQQWAEYKSKGDANTGRKSTPQYAELREAVQDHLLMLDSLVHKISQAENDIDDAAVRLSDIVRRMKKERKNSTRHTRLSIMPKNNGKDELLGGERSRRTSRSGEDRKKRELEDLEELASDLEEKRWNHHDLLDVARTLDSEQFRASLNQSVLHYRSLQKYREDTSSLAAEHEELEEHVAGFGQALGIEAPVAE